MERFAGWFVGTVIAWLIMGVVVFFSVWSPLIAPWKQDRMGRANLAQATQERQIQIEQARGELEAAKLRADAIEIIGSKAKEFPEYRTQEFIGAFAEALKSDSVETIIYVPTEASIPITDAGRTLR